MLSEDQIKLIREWTCKYGSGNCWTGIEGTAAKYIRWLLEEREELIRRIPGEEKPVEHSGRI